MNNLLTHDFIAHYKLHPAAGVNMVSASTNSLRFDLADDAKLIYPANQGVAKYGNPHGKEVTIINYECFIKSLPQAFQHKKEICDLIVYTSENEYFLLNESTNTNKGKGAKRNKAKSQMRQTLKDLTEVPRIHSFMMQHHVKQCCYFNKKAQAPQVLNATKAFNRISDIQENGYRMPDTDIESLGFELWEFSGDNKYILK